MIKAKALREYLCTRNKKMPLSLQNLARPLPLVSALHFSADSFRGTVELRVLITEGPRKKGPARSLKRFSLYRRALAIC